MPQQTDLMGLGLPNELSASLGNQATALTATGTTQATAATILSHLVEVTATGGNTGVILPAAAKIGTPYFIASVGGTAAKVWPPVGHFLNGTQNAGLTVGAATGTGIFIQTSRTKWWVIPQSTWS
jgi:hypothetical protein